jgi:AcrR family transcriptional regulator
MIGRPTEFYTEHARIVKMREDQPTALPKAARGAVRLRLLEAAERCLRRDGYATLSTRAVAESAQTQLSQIHYHFGSKQGLVLALLEHQNEKLLLRQAMFQREAPLSARWNQACDFLEEDLRSGYVRVLQEIIAASYSDAKLAAAARRVLDGWFELLKRFADEAGAALGGWGALHAEDVACLIGLAFLGAETMLLIQTDLPVHRALWAVGNTLQARANA